MITEQLWISGDEKTLVSARITAAQGKVGRAQIIYSGAEVPAKGALVRYAFGNRGLPVRTFWTGFVVEAGRQTLGSVMVHADELPAIFEQPLALSLRHPDAETLLEALALSVPLPVHTATLPEMRLARFVSTGSARDALEQALRRVYGPEGIWNAFADGSIWWGRRDESPWTSRKVPELPAGFVLREEAETGGLVIPSHPLLRPGVAVNYQGTQHLIDQVDFQGAEMTIVLIGNKSEI